MKRYELFQADELPPGNMRGVTVAGRPLVVVRAPDGSFTALRDTCPHYGPRLSEGLLGPLLVSDCPGRYDVAEDRFVIRCPRHGYEFDTVSGVCPADESVRVRTFPVEIEHGKIVIEM